MAYYEMTTDDINEDVVYVSAKELLDGCNKGEVMKTPLSYGEGSDREWYILDADGNWIAEAVPSESGNAESVARRIVACVNACEALLDALRIIDSVGVTIDAATRKVMDDLTPNV